MRFFHFFVVCLLVAQQTQADIAQVPLRKDGTVNLEEVLPSFKLAFPNFENSGHSNDFNGEFLGEPFAGEVVEGGTVQDFVLAIKAPTLSEHGNSLVALLATSAICAKSELRSGMVLWNERKSRDGVTWEVPTSCVSVTE